MRDAFVTIDELDRSRRFSTEVLSRYSEKYQTCGKGIELLKTGANSKSIREAMYQLQFGVVDRVVDAVVHQADQMLGHPTPVFLFVPIIVTTAELWCLKPGTTIEGIRAAGELEDVADQHELLLLHERPNNQLRQHSKDRFAVGLDARHKEALDRALAINGEGSFASYVERFTSSHPSLFVVIHYSRFKAAIERLLAFVRQAKILKVRTVKPTG